MGSCVHKDSPFEIARDPHKRTHRNPTGVLSLEDIPPEIRMDVILAPVPLEVTKERIDEISVSSVTEETNENSRSSINDMEESIGKAVHFSVRQSEMESLSTYIRSLPHGSCLKSVE
jgi:hypothetical protein